MKKLFIIFFFPFSFSSLYSQSISPVLISSSGNYFSNSNNSLSWSLGEVVIESFENNQISLTQGFHQPVQLIITNFDNTSNLNYNIKVYPSPASDFLTIENNTAQLGAEVQILSSDGKIVQYKKMNGSSETINIQSLPAGTYICLIHYKNSTLKKLKIEIIK